MPRGGKRNGTPGASYANRTDLNAAPSPLPPTAAPNQPYGAAGAQLAGQAAVPMAPPPSAAASGGPPGMVPPTAPAGPPPGGLGPFGGMTNRPGEPVTHGLAVGPGAGPEALNPTPDPMTTGAAMLNSLKEVSPQIAALRGVVNASIANRAAP